MTFLPRRDSVPARLRTLCLFCAVSTMGAAALQTAPGAPGPDHVHSGTNASASASSHPLAGRKPDAGQSAEGAHPPSTPSDAAAQPPGVHLTRGQLTIEADNSDLNTILEKVSSASGMTIQGLGKSARVFGQYGPASPRDVLTDLLSDTGYNFVMLGGANGTVPRELVLTAQNGNAPPTAAPAKSPAADNTGDADADDQEPLGPGAIPHPPPEPPEDPQARAQQHLQNLERIRQMQEQQEQQQQDNAPQ